MLRTLLVSISVAALLAQSAADKFNKPPEAVDQALRERIRAFYQAHVEGKFRIAEQYVADNTRDFYYTANKPKYVSFEISKIEYNDNFTNAKATIICEQYFPMPGFMDRPIKAPVPSTWKIEGGQWMWYVDPERLGMTPFGTMTAGPERTGPPPAAVRMPSPAEMNFIFQAVKLDKQEVILKAGEDSSGQVVIANTLPGLVNLKVIGAVPGVEAKLDRAELKNGEKAILTLRSNKISARSGALTIEVAQTARQLPIRIVVR